MVVPQSREGKIVTVLGVIFIVAMTPPVILLVNTPALVFGFPVYYLWAVMWGIFISIVLIWAGWRDAYALTNDQIPPELRETEDIVTEQTGTDTTGDTTRSSN